MYKKLSQKSTVKKINNKKFYFQVKIWFQNRRMKWKRSKKAQQEPRSGGKTDDTGNSRSSDRDIGNDVSINVSDTIEDSRETSQENSRNISELQEPLYRPYVV